MLSLAQFGAGLDAIPHRLRTRWASKTRPTLQNLYLTMKAERRRWFAACEERTMLSDAEREKLDDLRFMFGTDAGTLALVLEQLTDAMAMVNLHAVYCRVDKGPHAGKPPLDVAELLDLL